MLRNEMKYSFKSSLLALPTESENSTQATYVIFYCTFPIDSHHYQALSAYTKRELNLLKEERISLQRVIIRIEREIKNARKMKGQCCLDKSLYLIKLYWEIHTDMNGTADKYEWYR